MMETAHHFFITICAASGSGGMEVIMEKATKENRVITLNFVNYIMDKIEPNLKKGVDYEMIKREKEEIYSIFSKKGD